MKPESNAAADGEKTATPTPAATPVQLHCKVLVNGMVHNQAHHAAGKELPIPEATAKALAALTPPQVEILGAWTEPA